MRIKKLIFIVIFLNIILVVGCIPRSYTITKGGNVQNTLIITRAKISEITTKKMANSSNPINVEYDLYKQALLHIEENQLPQAMGILADLDDYKDASNLLEQLRYIVNGTYIGSGSFAVGAINSSGNVVVSCDETIIHRYNESKNWEDVKAICLKSGDSIEGVTQDGLILTTNRILIEETSSTGLSYAAALKMAKQVAKWNNILSFQMRMGQSGVALTKDQKVYISYPNSGNGETLDEWENIVSVEDGRCYVLGLTKSGKVLNLNIDYIGGINTKDWEDIVAICGETSILGLKSDGSVVSTGINRHGEGDVSNWSEIIAISTSSNSSLGLKSDGTVVSAGSNLHGQLNTSEWTDVVAIAAGSYFSIGLKSDGSMLLTGDGSSGGVNTPDVSQMVGLYVPTIVIP